MRDTEGREDGRERETDDIEKVMVTTTTRTSKSGSIISWVRDSGTNHPTQV